MNDFVIINYSTGENIKLSELEMLQIQLALYSTAAGYTKNGFPASAETLEKLGDKISNYMN